MFRVSYIVYVSQLTMHSGTAGNSFAKNPGDRSTQVAAVKNKKACRKRWLSTGQSVSSVCRNLADYCKLCVSLLYCVMLEQIGCSGGLVM